MNIKAFVIMILIVLFALVAWSNQTANCRHGQYKTFCVKGTSNE